MPNDLNYEYTFWGSCTRTFEEEQKQGVYARLMGLVWAGSGHSLDDYGWDCQNRSVIDIGAGPTSMLLRAKNLKRGTVVDPLIPNFPAWVRARYRAEGIDMLALQGEHESLVAGGIESHDEAWIYNCLAHCENPGKIITHAKQLARTLRIFEWVDLPVYEGHPTTINALQLNTWIRTGDRPFNGVRITGSINESGCVGNYFAGSFHFST